MGKKSIKKNEEKNYTFKYELVEGMILKRRNRFIMEVTIFDDKDEYKVNEPIDCHCPTTGSIGDLNVEGCPCLLSKSDNPKRKTMYTVEAISLNRVTDKNKTWIGINQNEANRYVEFYLRSGDFIKMIGKEKEIKREKFVGNSKIDFIVGKDTYLEVKTPLKNLAIDIPDYIKRKNTTPVSSDRLVRHFTELGKSIGLNKRAILLVCFLYNHPGFKVDVKVSKAHNAADKKIDEILKAFKTSVESGLDVWQVNFEITKKAVILKKYFKLEF